MSVCVLTLRIYFLFFLSVWVLLPFQGEIKMYIKIHPYSSNATSTRNDKTSTKHDTVCRQRRKRYVFPKKISPDQNSNCGASVAWLIMSLCKLKSLIGRRPPWRHRPPTSSYKWRHWTSSAIAISSGQCGGCRSAVYHTNDKLLLNDAQRPHTTAVPTDCTTWP